MTARHPHGITYETFKDVDLGSTSLSVGAMASPGPEDEGADEKRQRAAERVRRHRERKARGAVVVSAEMTPELIARLVEYGWIEKHQKRDKAKIGQAIPAALWALLLELRETEQGSRNALHISS